MDSDGVSRRRFLGTCTSAFAVAVAGCSVAPAEPDPDANGPVEAGPAGVEPDDSPTPPAPSDREGDQYDQFGRSGAGSGSGSATERRVGDDSPYGAVYRDTIGSVAEIRVYGRGESGQGTGFVYDDAGYLLTNQHVVENAGDVYARFAGDGWTRARVVGTDVYSDLAVLSIGSVPGDAEALPLHDSDPAVGAEVVAIGNPFGFSGSVSAGIVSGVNRTLDAPNDFTIPDAIQTDAPVNPGNSGGPLVTLDGRVAGVVNAGGGDNIGFAISAPLVRRVAPELLADGDYDHSYLGVRINPVGPLLAEANDLRRGRGVYVHSVVAGGPSDGALQGSTGTRTVNGTEQPVGGDVIVRMDGAPIPTPQALSSFLALETSPGDTITVEVVRDGSLSTVDLSLGARPEP